MAFGTIMFLFFNVIVTLGVHEHHNRIIDFIASRGYNVHFVGQVVHICITMSWLAFFYMAMFFNNTPYRIPGLIPVDCDDLDRDASSEKKDLVEPSPLPTKTRRGRSKSARRRRRTQPMDN